MGGTSAQTTGSRKSLATLALGFNSQVLSRFATGNASAIEHFKPKLPVRLMTADVRFGS